ncbi:ABC transporter permease [Flavobacterium suncheonense]|uniref:Permease n=1 Tax=Flavobacterium suncheonense GH29-5 = DSM 17707 TaxID=1121899 RepID=A0A0A2MCZ0_9FLAO|nr:FtsX-like permease family protein [Flavobacterium suncheonense]KGO89318.1 permease [Flavobacterium suncheonense GH29-5 = DSM 17707]
MIGKLAWRNTWFKPLSTILSIILLMSSVAIITVLILLQKQFEEQFSSNADDIDLVLGAQGSPLQLVLSSVYQLDAPTGNINYAEAKTWMQNPFVQSAIPLAYGDNYLGFKILGTTPEYLAKFGGRVEKGKMFAHTFEVVIGSEIASKLQLKVGDTFFGSHGNAKEGEKHEEAAYKVVGIASKTGKVVDNLILSDIQSVWAMHETHDHEDEAHPHGEIGHEHTEGDEQREEALLSEEGKEITAVLIKFRNKMGIVLWPRMIAQNTKMQAASPAIEINRLFTLFGIGLDALQYLAYGIMLISGISIFIALFNTLKERKYEFALLRIQGASRLQLLQTIVIESLVLCSIGFLFGTILGRVALMFISRSSDEAFKIAFDPLEFVWEKEGILFLVTIFVGLLAAFIPAVKAYRLNISKTLSNA